MPATEMITAKTRTITKSLISVLKSWNILFAYNVTVTAVMIVLALLFKRFEAGEFLSGEEGEHGSASGGDVAEFFCEVVFVQERY